MVSPFYDLLEQSRPPAAALELTRETRLQCLEQALHETWAELGPPQSEAADREFDQALDLRMLELEELHLELLRSTERRARYYDRLVLVMWRRMLMREAKGEQPIKRWLVVHVPTGEVKPVEARFAAEALELSRWLETDCVAREVPPDTEESQ